MLEEFSIGILKSKNIFDYVTPENLYFNTVNQPGMPVGTWLPRNKAEFGAMRAAGDGKQGLAQYKAQWEFLKKQNQDRFDFFKEKFKKADTFATTLGDRLKNNVVTRNLARPAVTFYKDVARPLIQIPMEGYQFYTDVANDIGDTIFDVGGEIAASTK